MRGILIVEDEVVVAMTLRRLLEETGYRVTAVAIDAESAMESLRQERPELILMDVGLGGEADGISLAHRIWSEVGGLPVLYLSGHTRKALAGHDFGPHFAGFLEKPTRPETLLKAVENSLRA